MHSGMVHENSPEAWNGQCGNVYIVVFLNCFFFGLQDDTVKFNFDIVVPFVFVCRSVCVCACVLCCWDALPVRCCERMFYCIMQWRVRSFILFRAGDCIVPDWLAALVDQPQKLLGLHEWEFTKWCWGRCGSYAESGVWQRLRLQLKQRPHSKRVSYGNNVYLFDIMYERCNRCWSPNTRAHGAIVNTTQ